MNKSRVSSPRRWRRFFIRAVVVLVVAMIGFAIAAPSGIGWIIGSKLKSALAAQLNARLDFASVVYQFPYGVRVEKAHLLMLSANGGADSWVDIDKLELSLAKLPLGKGAVVIQKLKIDNPTVHLASGFGSSTSNTTRPPVPSTPPQKLSDLFELQNVVLTNGRFEYDTIPLKKQIALPMVWDHLDLNMNTLPVSHSNYQFKVGISDLPVAVAKAAGSFDIDSLQLTVDNIDLALRCDPDQRSQQIPSQELEILRQYHLAGKLTMKGNAMIPFQSMDQSTFTANLELKNGHCQIPGWAGAITPSQCSITASRQTGPTQFTIAMRDEQRATVNVAGTIDFKMLLLDLQKAEMSIQCDPAKPITPLPESLAESLIKLKTGGQLTLQATARIPLQTPDRFWYGAKLTLKNGQCQPPGWTRPISPAKFVVTASNVPSAVADSLPSNFPSALPGKPAESHLWLSSLSAASGNQIFKIDGGELIFEPVEKTWTVRKLHGVADVGDGPGPLEGDNTRLYLPFIAAGDSASGLRIALDDGSGSFTANHVHLNQINGLLSFTPTGLKTSGLVATCATGSVKANVNLDWKTPASGSMTSLIYDGDVQLKQIDLHQLALEYTPDPAVRQQAFGQLDLDLKCRGSILQNSPPSGKDSALDRLAMQGDFDISNGHFVDIPILKEVVAAARIPGGSTVGEAAAQFDIAHQIINFKRAGASSPAIGIQGNGTLGFDRQTNMMFVATPLADWGKDVKGLGFVSDAGAAIVGKVQDVVNGVQRQLYQFRVTGDATNPTITAVPVPFLSDNFNTMFQQMAGNQQQGSVAEGLKRQSETTGK